MSFAIGQNDTSPRLIATLSAEYDTDYPESDQIIYNAGDVINLYIHRSGTWYSRNATVDQVIDGGKSVRVIVTLDGDDVANAGQYDIYFRNETIKLSFPSLGFDYIRVAQRGHE